MVGRLNTQSERVDGLALGEIITCAMVYYACPVYYSTTWEACHQYPPNPLVL